MKLWVLSDLHSEFDSPMQKGNLGRMPDADVCVVAGDVTNGCGNALRWLDRMIAPAMPVVYVAGNHEFYQDSVMEGLEWARVHAAECPNVHFLENDVAVIGGVRFLGCTLWTDYALDGRERTERAWAMANAEGRLNDHKIISWRRLPRYEAFTPLKALDLHERSRDFLRRELKTPFDAQTVVVTHHAPHPLSVNPKWKGSSLNPAFASDLSELMELYRPRLWVHGHMHDSADYFVRDTRVICNPKGYGNENPAFDPALVLEI
ncbi:metallophosphoesterase [Mesorhizobium sp. ES1-4]|uniref:metallophosphoesterase n=1 Tax=Mesorhizobium sp. ES1-4 TaxID=2876627 RepID=UPI001CCAE4A0|nr:metallophosphoesterase [Mesorhizobium sp. ES1-4]MBZ9798728.1 metallophosphoesterase [Mesorhizobium sp. ES1-4]